MKFIFAVLCLVVVSNEGLAEKCEKDNICQCLNKVDGLLENITFFLGYDQTAQDYCSGLESEKMCLEDIPEHCVDDFPVISRFLVLTEHNKRMFCGSNWKMYEDSMIPCVKANNAAFMRKCARQDISPDRLLCEIVDYFLCIAEFSKETCREIEVKYGKALEDYINTDRDLGCKFKETTDTMKSDMCGAAGYLVNSFWTLVTTVFSVLLIRNKLQ